MSEDVRRCPRCGAPHHDTEPASKHSGAGAVLDWDGDLCPTCEDGRLEKERKARELALARAVRKAQQRTTGENATLEEFT